MSLLAEMLMWAQVLLERVVMVYAMAKQEPFVEGRFTCVPYTVLYKVSTRVLNRPTLSCKLEKALLTMVIILSRNQACTMLHTRGLPFCLVMSEA